MWLLGSTAWLLLFLYLQAPQHYHHPRRVAHILHHILHHVASVLCLLHHCSSVPTRYLITRMYHSNCIFHFNSKSLSCFFVLTTHTVLLYIPSYYTYCLTTHTPLTSPHTPLQFSHIFSYPSHIPLSSLSYPYHILLISLSYPSDIPRTSPHTPYTPLVPPHIKLDTTVCSTLIVL